MNITTGIMANSVMLLATMPFVLWLAYGVLVQAILRRLGTGITGVALVLAASVVPFVPNLVQTYAAPVWLVAISTALLVVCLYVNARRHSAHESCQRPGMAGGVNRVPGCR